MRGGDEGTSHLLFLWLASHPGLNRNIADDALKVRTDHCRYRNGLNTCDRTANTGLAVGPLLPAFGLQFAAFERTTQRLVLLSQFADIDALTTQAITRFVESALHG
ncbi:hypothetical protein D3C78_1455470 [compost metagenome]